MKIALVKQEVYPDLYVCPPGTTDAAELLFSSAGRVGPIGLFSRLGAEFFIVEEDGAPECQTYREVIPQIADTLQLLKTHPLNELPGQEFKIPGSPYPNGRFAVPCREIDWSQYDVVISVNVSIPTAVVRRHPDVLFCYMIGEANLASKWARFGYDVCLTQEISRSVTTELGGTIDFPYTFVGPDCLERVLSRHLGRESRGDGLFSEINMSSERPVTRAPEALAPLAEQGYPIRLHKQRISDNLTEIYDAKYFVKLAGRKIRGNSVIEAISCGTLALLPREDVIHYQLIPEECSIETVEDLLGKVRFLDANPEEYRRLLGLQREIVRTLCFDDPLRSLELCAADKKKIASKSPLLFKMIRGKRHASAVARHLFR
jgi:hypothetical protein